METRKLLDAFLMAPTWEGRIPFIYKGEKLRPKIEAYYQTLEDKPVTTYLPEFDFMEDNPEPGQLPYLLYYLKISGRLGEFPVLILVTPDGPKIDWESYVEIRDRHLAAFFQKRERGPRTFRVLLKRESYWGADRKTFANLSDFLTYSVESPDQETKVSAFVSHDTPLAKKLKEIASWGLPPLAAMVELEWKRFPHGTDHLVINKMIVDGWILPEIQ